MVKRQPTDINTLWDCFFAAMEYSNVQDQTNRDKFVTCFDNALDVKETGRKKLTEGLSWIKPNFYVSLVGPNIAYLKDECGVNINNSYSGEKYLEYLDKLKKKNTNLVQLSIDSYKKPFLLPIKDTKFNIDECLKENGFFVQEGIPNAMDINCIVYLYTSKKNIKYKCVVVKIEPPDKIDFDDSKYEIDTRAKKKKKTGRIAKLALISTNNNSSLLTYRELCSIYKDFNPQRGQQIKDKKLIEHIESVFKKVDDNTTKHSHIADSVKDNFRENTDDIFNVGAYNKIFYGVPGCGKSYYINKVVLNKLLGSIDDGNEKVDNWEDSEYVFRTIFYQDYSHADFVGQYMPKRDRTTGNLTYEFVPKTFTQALQKAYENPDKNVVLIIEELNRGEAASIFGDLFQLLDRDDNGQSEYKINCDEIVDYLRQKWNEDSKNDDEFVSKIKENIKNSGKIYLPSNLYLLATMNTCDQNVFTLDTAFKRRWESEEIPNEFKSGSDLEDLYIPYIFDDAQNKITWRYFVEVINDKIKNAIESEFFGDDRQIGCYFVKKSYLCDSTDIHDFNYISSLEYKEKSKKFANKILEYLWNDVAKVNKEKWFKSGIKTLHDAISAFEENKQVFADDLHTELMNTKTAQTVQQQENTEEEVND